MIDTLRSKIDVVRSLGERVSLLRLRNRSYILVENRRDRVSERTDRLIPLRPVSGGRSVWQRFMRRRYNGVNSPNRSTICVVTASSMYVSCMVIIMFL